MSVRVQEKSQYTLHWLQLKTSQGHIRVSLHPFVIHDSNLRWGGLNNDGKNEVLLPVTAVPLEHISPRSQNSKKCGQFDHMYRTGHRRHVLLGEGRVEWSGYHIL